MSDKYVSVLQALGNQRYRESHGMWFDDFEVGDVYEHRPGRTITEADNVWQSLINHNSNPLHFDHEYCKDTEFGKPVVSSLVTFSIINGLAISCLSARAVANLGWKEVRLTAPVFVGDTVYATSTILEKRLSNSRPNQGIITAQTVGHNSNQVEIMVCQRSFLVPCRTAA